MVVNNPRCFNTKSTESSEQNLAASLPSCCESPKTFTMSKGEWHEASKIPVLLCRCKIYTSIFVVSQSLGGPATARPVSGLGAGLDKSCTRSNRLRRSEQAGRVQYRTMRGKNFEPFVFVSLTLHTSEPNQKLVRVNFPLLETQTSTNFAKELTLGILVTGDEHSIE